MVEKLDILMMCNNTSMNTVVGQMINMVLYPIGNHSYNDIAAKDKRLKEVKVLYIERSDLDYLELETNEENKKIKEQLLFLEHHEVDEVANLIHMFKGHDHQISEKINSYVRNLCKICKDNGTELRFWVINPLDWAFFLNNGFYFINGEPQMYEGMNPYPMEVNSFREAMSFTDDIEFEAEEVYNKIFSGDIYNDDLLTLAVKLEELIRLMTYTI